MAEVTPVIATEEEVEQSSVKAAGRGRGKAKGRGRGKVKGKAKGKAKKVAAAADGEEGATKPKKEKAPNLRAKVEEEIGNRDIQEVITEAKALVDQLQAAVAKAQEAEVSYETNILEGKTKMEEASANVDSCVHKETLALEKYKAAQQALIDIKKKVADKKLEVGEEDKALDVLASEGEMQKKEADLVKAKLEAQEAKEAAKKAYEEAKLKEKEVAEAMKAKRAALAITDDPEAEAKAKADAQRELEEAKARKEVKVLGSTAAKDLKIQLKELEKQRADRDKARAMAFKDAAGLGKGPKKRLAAIGDGSAASPAKATKIQDVD